MLGDDCWPPLDNWNTEDLAAAFYDIGKLLLWEKDPMNKARIIAKLRVTELRDIPKSLRYTEGDSPEGESWTCSVEVLQQNLAGIGPADEHPVPDDGVDPHPLPAFDPEAEIHQAPNNDNNLNEEMVGWGHWALPPAADGPQPM